MIHKLSFNQIAIATLLAGVSAAAVNSILFFIFHGAGIISDSVFVQPGQPMGIIPVIFSSVLPSVIAGLLFFVLEKYTKRGLVIFSITAVILLALSFMNPFMALKGISLGYGLALCSMHVVVATALLYFFRTHKAKHAAKQA